MGLAEAGLGEAGTGRLVAFGTATCMILDHPPPKTLADLPAKFLDEKLIKIGGKAGVL